MREVTIRLPDKYDRVLIVTAIGLQGNNCNVAPHAIDLNDGTIISYDGEKWTQRKALPLSPLLKDVCE